MSDENKQEEVKEVEEEEIVEDDLDIDDLDELDNEPEDDSGESVDYKTQVDEFRKRAERAESGLLKEREKRKKLRRLLSEQKASGTSVEEPTEPDEDPMEKVLNKFEERQVTKLVRRKISEMTEDPDKRELIRLRFETLRSGELDEDVVLDELEDASLLVDKRSYIANAEKKARKRVAQKTVLKMASDNVQTSVEERGASVTRRDRIIAKSVNMDPKKYAKYQKDPRLNVK